MEVTLPLSTSNRTYHTEHEGCESDRGCALCRRRRCLDNPGMEMRRCRSASIAPPHRCAHQSRPYTRDIFRTSRARRGDPTPGQSLLGTNYRRVSRSDQFSAPLVRRDRDAAPHPAPVNGVRHSCERPKLRTPKVGNFHQAHVDAMRQIDRHARERPVLGAPQVCAHVIAVGHRSGRGAIERVSRNDDERSIRKRTLTGKPYT